MLAGLSHHIHMRRVFHFLQQLRADYWQLVGNCSGSSQIADCRQYLGIIRLFLIIGSIFIIDRNVITAHYYY